jgi:hypothetical protein
MTGSRRAAASLLIGLLAPICCGVVLGLFEPPKFPRGSEPSWPSPTPPGWPHYPAQVARPGAGTQAEGTAGVATLAKGFGRSLRVTRVYEMKAGQRTWYTMAEFRTGFPLASAAAIRLSSPGWQDGTGLSAALRRGISLGPPRYADLHFGPTLPLLIEPLPFLVNALAWGSVSWLGLWSISMALAKRRQRLGQCARCGYPRQPDAVCPECGT